MAGTTQDTNSALSSKVVAFLEAMLHKTEDAQGLPWEHIADVLVWDEEQEESVKILEEVRSGYYRDTYFDEMCKELGCHPSEVDAEDDAALDNMNDVIEMYSAKSLDDAAREQAVSLARGFLATQEIVDDNEVARYLEHEIGEALIFTLAHKLSSSALDLVWSGHSG